jgi:2-polyprenyl-6-methoxyphenol hydroxylase-like FAD-dependent oxidoreductase
LKKKSSRCRRVAAGETILEAAILVGVDGRNSTVARLCNLLPRPKRERVALQTHIPLPNKFGNRAVLQFLPEGYSGQAPVNENELNLCLVGRPPTIASLRRWAERNFGIAADHAWRTITSLTRAPISAVHENLFFIGDAALLALTWACIGGDSGLIGWRARLFCHRASHRL